MHINWRVYIYILIIYILFVCVTIVTADIEPYELEDFLADLLNHEFDIVTDDGSLQQVLLELLCTSYYQMKTM